MCLTVYSARGKGRKNTTKKEDTPLILSGPPPRGYRMNSSQLNNGIDINHQPGGVRVIPNLAALQIGLEATDGQGQKETI